MWEAAVPIAAGVVGSIAQWQNSQQAARASADERDRMQGIIDAMKDPNFDPRDFTSEQYAVASKYVPQLANYIEEKAPQTVQATAAGEAGREAQLSALGRLKTLSETGEDLQSQVLRQKALGDAAAQNQAQQATIRQNAAQRGLGGSGLEFMQSMMAQQGSNQAASHNAQDAALQAYQTRLDAMKNSASLGGDIRQSDMSEQARNAQIINDYNQRKAAEANRYQQYVANANNQGQLYNLGNQQRIAEANVGLRNADAARAQGRADMIQRENYNAAMNRANMNIGQAGRNLEGINQAAAGRAAAIGGLQQAAGSSANYYQQSNASDRNYALEKKKYDYLYGGDSGSGGGGAQRTSGSGFNDNEVVDI